MLISQIRKLDKIQLGSSISALLDAIRKAEPDGFFVNLNAMPKDDHIIIISITTKKNVYKKEVTL